MMKTLLLITSLASAAAAGGKLTFEDGSSTAEISYSASGGLEIPGFSKTSDVYTKTEIDAQLGTLTAQLQHVSSISDAQTSALSILEAKPAVPQGAILMWSGTIAAMPSGWALCDGANGTPNMLNRFVSSIADKTTDPGGTGGANYHDMGHSHSFSGSADSVSATGCNRDEHWSWCGGTHANPMGGQNKIGTHDRSISGSIGESGSQSLDIRPEYYEVAFIMKL